MSTKQIVYRNYQLANDTIRVLLVRQDDSDDFDLVAIGSFAHLNSHPLKSEAEADLFMRGLMAGRAPSVEAFSTSINPRNEMSKVFGAPESPDVD